MRNEKLIVLDEQGQTSTLYADDLPDFGPVAQVKRASSVEWGLVPGSGGWDVRLTNEPFNGPYAGLFVVSPLTALPLEKVTALVQRGLYAGFQSRQAALDAEVAFLQKNVLGRF